MADKDQKLTKSGKPRKAPEPRPVFVIFQGEAPEIVSVTRNAQKALEVMAENDGCSYRRVMVD